MAEDTFSVYVFHGIGHSRAAHLVDAESAVRVAADLVHRELGHRIIITDGGDRIAWEWTPESGVRMGVG